MYEFTLGDIGKAIFRQLDRTETGLRSQGPRGIGISRNFKIGLDPRSTLAERLARRVR